MMKRTASFLVEKRKVFLCLFLLLAAVCALLAGKVRINYDLTEYLPEDSRMKQGLRRMEQEFGKESSSQLRVMISGLSEEEKEEAHRWLSGFDHLSLVSWEPGEEYNRDGYALYEITADFDAHLFEHSIEVQLPFLQYFSDDFSIVPIVMGSQSFSASTDLAKAIFDSAQKLNKSYCVIASTDLSHFNNQEKANTVDGFVLEDIEHMNEFKLYEEVIQYNITMCGYGPVMTTIAISKMCDKHKCEILQYKTSGDVTGDLTSVVGYASGIFK